MRPSGRLETALAFEADVITLDPILLGTALAGAPLILTVVVEGHHGLAESQPARLRWETAAGETGETQAVTDALGVASFTVTAPAGDVSYTVWVGDLSSNGVRITGVPL